MSRPGRAGQVWMAVLIGLLLTAASGCDVISTGTTVRLINNTNYVLETIVLYHKEQLIPEFRLKDVGTEARYTIPAGETVTFSRDCDALQAIRVEGDLKILFGLGPSKTSRVYRDGTDFGCNDTLTFTFTTNSLGTSLNIAFGN